jgi:hypothetical protein
VLFEGHQAGFPRIRTSVRNLLTTTYAHAFVSVPPVLLGSGVGAALLVDHLVAVLEVTLERCLGQAQFLALVVVQDSIPPLRTLPWWRGGRALLGGRARDAVLGARRCLVFGNCFLLGCVSLDITPGRTKKLSRAEEVRAGEGESGCALWLFCFPAPFAGAILQACQAGR